MSRAWEQFDPPTMSQFLQAALAERRPGRSAQRRMGHHLAYGRHHGPVPEGARRAAVLVALQHTAQGWSLPVILRPETMRSHAGQVSLPGGMIESDETPAQTALREFEEELGAATASVQIMGQLSPVYVFVTDFEITPFVAVCQQPLEFVPNPHEVAAVMDLRLAELVVESCRGWHVIERRGLTFRVPHFEVAGQKVWGATSLILAEFLALFGRC